MDDGEAQKFEWLNFFKTIVTKVDGRVRNEIQRKLDWTKDEAFGLSSLPSIDTTLIHCLLTISLGEGGGGGEVKGSLQDRRWAVDSFQLSFVYNNIPRDGL